MKIGFIGQGFIGSTMYKVFEQVDGLDVRAFDLDPDRCKNTIEDVAECEFVFIALPTPMDLDTGRCHTKILERAIVDFRQHSKDSVIVVKSTVPPGTTERLHFDYGPILFSPEFLTEASPYEDFCNLGYQIIGVPDLESTGHADRLANVFYEAHIQGIIHSAKVYTVSSRMAELVKYARNCYLATRLSFFNEMKQIADALELPYDNLRFYVGLDERVGRHYNRIDEQNRGFGGHCLVKDLNALISLAKDLNVDPKVLAAVNEKNMEVRQHRDWEDQPGRVVIRNEDG